MCEVLADSACPSKAMQSCGKVGLSMDSLSSLKSQPCLVSTVRSRKPLSTSQAEALDNILADGPYPLKPIDDKFCESGYFSGESKLSIRTTTENLMTADELDKFNKENLEPLLFEIAEELGCCWKDVGRQLLKKECSIENINEDYNKVTEKSYQMLLKWKNENGSKASITDIFKCLNHIGKEHVAEKLLGYLTDGIARECEMILLLSPKKIRSESMTAPIFNIPERHKDITVEKQLRLQDDDEIYLCSSNITKTKYILREMEEQPKVYRWAARPVISNKQLLSKKKTLRKTNEFLKDLQFKEETVKRLKSITETLQERLHVKHMTFCEEDLKCLNCEKTALMRELLEKDLSLLHHELVNMSKGNRRLSVSGIPTERIYDLAERAYNVCEEHKKFHDKLSKISKLPRRCSMEVLDEVDDVSAPDTCEDPLKCTLNILSHLGRRKKVVQSLTPKERKKLGKKVQRHSSDKSKSRFFIPVVDNQETSSRPNWPTRIGSKIFAPRKRSTEKKHHKKSNEQQNKEVSQKSQTMPPTKSYKAPPEDETVTSVHHARCYTFPSSLSEMSNGKQSLYGPEDLDLDDVTFIGETSSCGKELQMISDPMSQTSGLPLSSRSSDSNLEQVASSRRHGVTHNPFSTRNVCLFDNRSQGVMEIVARQKSIMVRQRSFSNGDIKEICKHHHQEQQVQDKLCSQQSSPELNTICDVLWKTEIDCDTVFFV